jgi:hypothetical protein
MSKSKPGDRIAIRVPAGERSPEDRALDLVVRRVGCNDPDCPSCEGHWRDEGLPDNQPN